MEMNSIAPSRAFARVTALLSFPLILSGCATLTPRNETPGWFTSPRRHDSSHLYFPAKSEGAPSIQQARLDALTSIKTQIAKYIYSEVRVGEGDHISGSPIMGSVDLHEVEPFAVHHARVAGQWTVWMLGRYPRSEYERIRDRLEVGVALETKWREAQSAINRQQFKEGERLLSEILDSYDKALRVSFNLEAVKLELAQIYLNQNRGLRARQWIADVQKTSPLAAWRSKADLLAGQVPPVSLGDAFDGQTVGIYSATKKDGPVTFDSGLAQELSARLAQHGIQTVLPQQSVIGSKQIIDTEATERVVSMLQSLSADVVILLLLEVDSSKTGKKVRIPGSTSYVNELDARLTYWIIRASDGLLLASDSTSGFSHSPRRLLTTVLTHRRHLPQHAPAIAEGLGVY